MSHYSKLLELGIPLEKLKGCNVLVTGGNGLIASSFIDALIYINREKNLGITVFSLCRNAEKANQRFRSYIESKDFRLLIQDVTDPLDEALEFQYIIHAASAAHPSAFNETPVDVMKANFLGTLNLLEYTVRHKNTRFLFVSSSEVYGENEEGVESFREDMSGCINFARFRACYPESKRASETLCLSFKKQYGVDIVIVRPAFIYGRNIIDSNTRADVYFLRQVLDHQDIVMYSEGTQVRSYCYINDCISGMLFVLLCGVNGEVYNIGNPQCVVTLKEYAQTLADIGGVKLRYEPKTAPEGVVFLKTTRCVLNTEKLEALGWKARYSLRDGIRDIINPK